MTAATSKTFPPPPFKVRVSRGSLQSLYTPQQVAIVCAILLRPYFDGDDKGQLFRDLTTDVVMCAVLSGYVRVEFPPNT